MHTNNNAVLVTTAILLGQYNFETAIATAVLGGWDTDCNGATVGSIMGAKLGIRDLPKKLDGFAQRRIICLSQRF